MRKQDVPPFTALFPNPALLVSCGTFENPNIITIAWASTVCRDPPMVSIAMTPSRYSYNLILENKDFVINLPRASDVEKVDLCGNISGRNHSKFDVCDFTIERSTKVNSPRIKECPISIECYLDKTIHIGSHDLFIGQIVNVAIDSSILKNNAPDLDNMDILVYTQGQYYAIGDIIGSYGFSLKNRNI